eukprot:TRINITY_DN37308_c1_g2_i1.p1 TRINITY_DN37308_c1_g2~~TRINITY_DN37308_c1_g2_i1.p1  ORF type:complete len:297 (-),score=34.47 TRINITY_DN37308_c1_g2_i1:82-972(-)
MLSGSEAKMTTCPTTLANVQHFYRASSLLILTARCPGLYTRVESYSADRQILQGVKKDIYNAPGDDYTLHIDRSKPVKRNWWFDNTMKYGMAYGGYTAGAQAGGLVGAAFGRTAGLHAGETLSEGATRLWHGHGKIMHTDEHEKLMKRNEMMKKQTKDMDTHMMKMLAKKKVPKPIPPAVDEYDPYDGPSGLDPESDMSRVLKQHGVISRDWINAPSEKYQLKIDHEKKMQPWLKHGWRFATTLAGAAAGQAVGAPYGPWGAYLGESAGLTVGGQASRTGIGMGEVSIVPRPGYED